MALLCLNIIINHKFINIYAGDYQNKTQGKCRLAARFCIDR